MTLSSSLSLALSVTWAASHISQYGMAITGLNGVADAMTCTSHDGGREPHASWLAPCVYLTSTQYGLVTSIFTLGGLCGCLLSNRVCQSAGKIGALRSSAVLVLIGSLCFALANSIYTMLLGRIIIGIGCGLATVTVPLYLADSAPPSLKRTLGVASQLFVVFGMTLAHCLSFALGQPTLWRLVPVVSAGLSVLQLLGSVVVREDKGTEGKPTVDEEAPLLMTQQAKAVSIWSLITSTDPVVKRGFAVVVITQLSQQLCGVAPVMYFSTRILKPVFPGNSRLVSLFILLLKIPLTLAPALLIERLGSGRILLFSSLVMSLSALVLAYGLNTSSPGASVVAILSFVSAYSVGLGPVTWMVISEVMSKDHATAAGAVGIGLNWTFNFVMGSSFLPLQHALSQDGRKEGNIFYLIAGMCVVIFVSIRVGYAAFGRVTSR